MLILAKFGVGQHRPPEHQLQDNLHNLRQQFLVLPPPQSGNLTGFRVSLALFMVMIYNGKKKATTDLKKPHI